ncbi:MAG TPA: Y-family DNA polymerase [Bacilli bacterium]|nr:Y-family DNA polymerase [Bacilli bacterium]
MIFEVSSMDNLYVKRNILCIDLKSFFASVECVDRGLDPFTTPLVVADPTRNGAITLAVTPYLKKMGIPSRGRVFELPKNVPIIKVPPRMHLYQEKSKEVISVYLEFISIEDLYIYSIDECFLDVTDYLKMYKMDDYNLARKIINEVYNKTGLTVTAGIGPNMLLAKVAMDVDAKHVKDNIAYWDYDSIPDHLWKITPLSKMWGIGHGLETSLNKMGLYSVGDVAKYDINKLKKKFGIIGEELWYHTNGIDNTKVSDLNKEPVKEKSISHSQVLFKDYYGYNIPIILYETLDTLCRELRAKHKLCGLVGLSVQYNHTIGGGFHHSMKLGCNTDDENKIFSYITYMFDKYYQDNLPIRTIGISLGGLSDNGTLQLNLFEDYKDIKSNKDINDAIDSIKAKFGSNTLLKASSLLNDSTIKERNEKIGGHHV